MSEVIRKYYLENNVQPLIISKKLEIFDRNPDISNEFEKWIEEKIYVDGVEIEEYTASRLAGLSRHLDGEGAFVLLTELRENPEKAKKRIKSGFKIR